MLDLAIHILKSKKANFDPDKFEDRYESALTELIKAKQAGKPAPKAAEAKPSNVINLMDALRRSVKAEKGGRRPPRRAPRAPATARTTHRAQARASHASNARQARRLRRGASLHGDAEDLSRQARFRQDAGAARRGAAASKGHRYVIQKHAATRLHYDLRLELDGVMLSWAVTRGPSLVPGDKRLAIHVEDHPIEYNTFEGTIPKGEYGGGTVMIWDRGTLDARRRSAQGPAEGPSRLRAATARSSRAAGIWCACSKRPGERQEPWLLIKGDDEYARDEIAIRTSWRSMPNSAATGRTMDEIAGGKKKVWHSNKPATEQSGRRRAAPRASRAAREQRRASRARAAPRAQSRSEAAQSARQAIGAIAGRAQGAAAGFRRAVPRDAQQQGARRRATGVHEIKFDGYRIQARHRRRQGHTARPAPGSTGPRNFRPIATACAALADHDAILDGEIVPSMKAACRISPPCRTISRPAARTGWSITSSICSISTATI